MTSERFFELLQYSDEDLLLRAEQAKTGHRKKKSSWRKWGVIAACFCLLISAAIAIPMQRRHPVDKNYPEDLIVASEDTNYQFAAIHADWASYDTAEEINQASTNIFSGKVTEISFEIIDMKTGEVDRSPDSESTSRMLYTVYTISLTESYKGQNPSEVKICKMGGIVGFNDSVQYQLVESTGVISKYDGIPVMENNCTLAVGEEYLFCTSHTVGDFDFVINQTQFAHPINSKNATRIIKTCK